MITYHKNRHQSLSKKKFLIFAPSEMEDFIYIYMMMIYIYIYVNKKNILGCKLSRHFTHNQTMYFFRQVRFTCIYVYIYIYVFVHLTP